MKQEETYATVFIGIILAMAITRIVSFLANLLVFRKLSNPSLSHFSWIFLLVALIVQSWWEMQDTWQFDQIDSFWVLACLLLSPALIYLATALICPDIAAGADSPALSGNKLRKYYSDIRTKFYLLISLLFLVLIFESIYMQIGHISDLTSPDNIMRLIAIIWFTYVACAVQKYDVLDSVTPSLALLIFLSYEAFANWNIL